MTRSLTGILLASAMLLLLLVVGCSRTKLGVSPVAPQEISLSEKISLYPGAAALKGQRAEEFLSIEEAPPPEVALDSRIIRELAARVSPTVVSIFTRTKTAYQFKLIPIPTSGLRFALEGEALGSGFFVNAAGYVVTNAHVLVDATEIVLRTESGDIYPAEIVAADPVYDLALLKAKAASDIRFPVLPIGTSDNVQIGDWVIAVGNPLGLGHTVTHGIISQTGRTFVPELKPGERQVAFVQTDTPINPGSSGGPLITLGGVLVGVNTAVLVNSQGISFCVPAAQVREFIDSVLAGNGTSKPLSTIAK